MTVTRYKRSREVSVDSIRDAVLGVTRHSPKIAISAKSAELAKPAEPAKLNGHAREIEDLTKHHAEVIVRPAMRISDTVMARAKRKSRGAASNIGVIATQQFKAYEPPPGVLPTDAKPEMAMDDGLQSWAENSFTNAWNFANPFGEAFAEGIGFLGYAYLSQLTQRPEYRRISDRIATEMTRKWIRLTISGEAKPNIEDDDDDLAHDRAPDRPLDEEDEIEDASGNTVDHEDDGEADRDVDEDLDDEPTPEEIAQRKRNDALQKKLKEIEEDMKRLDVRGKFKQVAEFDGFMGRAHLYIDTGESNDPEELLTDLGNGSDDTSRSKFKKGSLRNVKHIEPIWCYPVRYNAQDPLSDDWYNPQIWFAMAKQIHASRLLTFVGRPVPDILKPSYAFGGLSMSQMAKPYVDNWLRTRQAVTNLIESFSVSGVYTNAQSLLQGGGEEVLDRIDLFNITRSNAGSMVLDKETEEFFNISTPLGTLDHLQAQSQEQMSSVSGIPLIVLLGITPSGLNACLPGDTLIETDRGQVPIRDVTLADLVMTRDGLAPLTFSGITKYATELIEIRTASTVLRCTGNHPIWLPSINAFVPAENVRRGDILLLTGEKSAVLKIPRPSHGVGNGGGGAQTDIMPRGTLTPSSLSFSIAECGKLIAGLFRKVSISTTLIATSNIIRSSIFSRCTQFFTPSIMVLKLAFDGLTAQHQGSVCVAGPSSLPQEGKNFAATRACWRTGEQTGYPKQNHLPSVFARCAARLSLHLARVLNFVRANVLPRAKIAQDINARTILSTLKNTNRLNEKLDGLQFAIPRENASDATLNSRQPGEAASCTARSHAKIAQGSNARVLSVRKIQASEPVYDLSVAKGHLPEFFANGILTHNSSEGELRVFYDLIHAMQESLFRDKLKRIIDFVQLNLYGKVDPAIGFEFEPLWSLDEKGEAEVRKIKAETHMLYVDGGIFGQEEVRNIEIADENSPYNGLDPDDMPPAPAEQGLVSPGKGSMGGEGGDGHAMEGAADSVGGELIEVADGVFAFEGALDDNQFDESQHKRDQEGKFATTGTSGEGSGVAEAAAKLFKSKKEHIGHLLSKGTTAKEVMQTMGWPSVSMPAQAKSLGMKLEKKDGKYFGVKMTPEELAAAKAAQPPKKKQEAVTEQAAEVLAEKTPAKPKATPEELKKAAKNTPVPISSSNPYAVQAIKDFNEKYVGKTGLTEAQLTQKIEDYKVVKQTIDAAAEGEKAAQAEAQKKAQEKANAAQQQAANEEAERQAKKKAELEEQFAKDPDLKVHYEAMEALFGGAHATEKYLQHAMIKVKAAGLKDKMGAADAVPIIAYTGSHYGDVNRELRKGTMTLEQYKFTKSLNAGLEKLPKYTQTTYRRASLKPEQFKAYEVGKVVEERGFTSTSKNQGTWSGDYSYTIHGKNGRDVEKLSSHPSEAEVLFKSGSRFFVKSVKGNHIELEEV